MNKCLICQEPISDKATFCSDAHRKAYSRKLKVGHLPEQVGQKPTRTLDFKPSRTDRLFEERNPGYYDFGDTDFERICTVCGRTFKTRLKLLRQCSPKCFVKMTDLLTTGGREEKL